MSNSARSVVMHKRIRDLCNGLLWAGLAVVAGCSSQDFGRPVGRYGDIIDSGHAYVEKDTEAEALLRAQQLSAVLSAWEQQRDDAGLDYTIGSDDVLQIGIMALETPGVISKLDRTVSKDGTINLPLIGDTQVGGLSARQLEKQIVGQYDGVYLNEPQVTVAVTEYRSSPIVVTGMVKNPGVYYLKHNQSSVLDILSQAGGLTTFAGYELHIIRRPEMAGISGAEAAATPIAVTVAEVEAAEGDEGEKDGATVSPVAESVDGIMETPGDNAPVAGDATMAVLDETPVSGPDADGQGIAVAHADPGAADSAGMANEEALDSLTNVVTAVPQAAVEETQAKRSLFARMFGLGRKKHAAQPVEDDEIAGAPQGTDEADEAVPTPQEATAVLAPPVGGEGALAHAALEVDEFGGAVSAEAMPGAVAETSPTAVEEVAELEQKTPFKKTPDIIAVDLRELLESGDVRLNVPIYGGDIVSIPPGKKESVYVLGYVQRPGSFELAGKREVEALQAVAMAGGLSAAARGENTVLIRRMKDGRKVVPVDLTKIARGSRPPLYLQSGDTLIVGSSFFGKIGEFIKPSVGASASLTPGL